MSSRSIAALQSRAILSGTASTAVRSAAPGAVSCTIAGDAVASNPMNRSRAAEEMEWRAAVAEDSRSDVVRTVREIPS